jgi:hypothetical protein
MLAATAMLLPRPSWPPPPHCQRCRCTDHCHCAAATKLLLPPRCCQAATATAVAFVFIVVVIVVIVAISIAVATTAFSLLLIVVCAPPLLLPLGSLLPPPLRCRCIILQMVLLATSNFENQAKIMTCGTLTPVVFWRICTADSTFF